MYNILMKDLELIFRTKIWIVPLLYSFFGISFFYSKNQSFSASFFLILIFYIIINTLFSYDDKYGGEKFIYSFPIKRSDAVKGKYLLLILFILIFSVIFLVAWIVVNILNVDFFSKITLEIFSFRIALSFVTIGVFFGITMALHYRYGYSKLRWLNFIILVITSIITGIISDVFTESSGNLSEIFLPFSILFFVVALYSSMMISIKFCENRDI